MAEPVDWSGEPELRRIGQLIYYGWKNRPDPPHWATVGKITSGPYGLMYEAAELAIDAQIDAAYRINRGDVADKDQYGHVERERVESLGFKLYPQPGGMQV